MTDTPLRDRVARSFERQRHMLALGAELGRVEPGLVEIELPFALKLTQQHGFLHAGAIAAIADSAAGYAALTLMPDDAAVLSVEFKLNLLAPAAGERFLARGRVVRAGRTLSTVAADVLAFNDGAPKPVATLLGTMIRTDARNGQVG
ncbi:MAG: PaaI family thioesterase [Phycisphaerae bacterium]|nr:PaaI family thioesterase [Phycisphaerae bacterium]